MKKIATLLLSSALCFGLSAQLQLENPDFEDWEGSGSQFEPVNWSSLKTADGFGAGTAPEVISQSTDAHSGDFSVQLKAKSILGIVANGIITNGRVKADSFDPEQGYVFMNATDDRWHTKFTARPDSLVGWYKFDPVDNDNAKVEVLLVKGTHARLPMDETTIENRIGNARFEISAETSEWKRFSTPFVYYTEEIPEYVLTVINAGDSTSAVDGTTLFVDDLELIYNEGNTSGVEDENYDQMKLFAAEGNLYFQLENYDESEYEVVDFSGRILQAGKVKSTVPFHYQSGVYIVKVWDKKRTYVRKIYIP